MKIITLFFSVLSLCIVSLFLNPSVIEAKILNKELVNKAVLSAGYSAQFCPINLGDTPLNVGDFSSGLFKNKESYPCIGNNEEVRFGQVTLYLRQNSEETPPKAIENVVLFGEDIFRLDSVEFIYYPDTNTGGKFFAGGGSENEIVKGLEIVKSSTLHRTDPTLPFGQEMVPNSEMSTHYDLGGNINGMLFRLAGKAYKLVAINNEVYDKVLVDYTQETSARPTPSSVTTDGEEIIASEVTVEGCKIKVTTNKREVFLSTHFLEFNPQTKCYQFVLNPVSPSGKYVAFEDVSGGIDSQIRVYSLGHNKDVSLEVLGTSTIKYMNFLPDDRLVVISGYFGYFGKEWAGQWLRIYDIPRLFNNYPGSVDQQYNYFKLSDDNLIVINLPDKGTDYTSFSVDGSTIKLLGSNSSMIYSLNLDTLSSNVGYRNVQLFYYNKTLDPKFDCISEAVIPVSREISMTKTPIQDTIKLLIEGKLTEKEKAGGFSTEFPYPGFKLLGTNLKDGVLTLDFPEMPSFTTGGSCRVGILRAEIEKTAKQFPEVKEVKYTSIEMFQP